MDRRFLQDNWTDMRGHLKGWWDELTDEDLDLVNGNDEELIRMLQERYGYTEEMARAEIAEHLAEYDPESGSI
jgi:uncharacterized protein YjbJ (UPF0337 family)